MVAAEQRKIQDKQAEKLYGFDVEDLSELDKYLTPRSSG